jgi:predicted dehydrogenase
VVAAFLPKARDAPNNNTFLQVCSIKDLYQELHMRRVNVGIIGLGEVAQIIHLPILSALSERFRIVALCDLSQELLRLMGERYNIDKLYSDYHLLVEQEDLDAVLVLNSDEYHADSAIAAIRNGKHVLVEKPMCLTLREADEIIRVRDKAGVQVMVGYMRRFAPAFLEGVRQVLQIEKIRYARVRDIIGANRLIIEQSSVVHYPQDIPAQAKEERTERARELVREAIGDAPQELVGAYRLLTGLGCHDLSAMREIIGMPRRVVAAVQRNRFMSAVFDHDGFYTTFEMGTDSQRRFDAHIEVYGDTKCVHVQYDTPYIRHLPTTLHIHETLGDAYEKRIVRPTFTDPYTYELLAFYDVVTQNIRPKTSPEDFKQDLELFAMIIDSLARNGV